MVLITKQVDHTHTQESLEKYQLPYIVNQYIIYCITIVTFCNFVVLVLLTLMWTVNRHLFRRILKVN